MALEHNLENGSVIALGNFDGMHMGHRTVIDSAVDMADKLKVVPCVLLFTEHSLKSLKGEAPTQLYSGNVKEKVLNQLSVKVCYIDFNEIRDMTANEFVKEVLINRFNAKGICCGFNYHFGKNATGDVNDLKNICKKYKIDLSVSPPTEYIGEPISSTRIRHALKSGEIEQVNQMLGRVFSYQSEVVNGDKRGASTLHFPTINQQFDENLTIPKYGVYASYSLVKGKCYPSVTNIGVRPTVGTDELVSETYIIDFNDDIYGEYVEVGLLEYLRQEKKFESFDKLKEEIAKNVNNAKKVFEIKKNAHTI